MTGPAWLNDDLPFPDGPMGVTHRLSSLNLRFRWEYLAAVEADARARLGRPLTQEELVRVLARYPGDIGSAARPLTG